MAAKFSAPAGYTARVEVLRERRKTLNAYAELLGTQLGNQLELSAHDVFWATERRRTELGDWTEKVSDVRFQAAADWTREDFERHRSTLASAAAAAVEMQCTIAESPWRGFAPQLLVRGDELPVLRVVDEAARHADSMALAAAALAESVSYDGWTLRELLDAKTGLDALPTLGQSTPSALLALLHPHGLASVESSKALVTQLGASLADARDLRDRALSHVRTVEVTDFERFNASTRTAAEELSTPALSLSAKQLGEAARSLIDRLQSLRSVLNDRIAQAPSDSSDLSAQLTARQSLLAEQSIVSQPAHALTKIEGLALQRLKHLSSALIRVTDLLLTVGLPFSGHTDDIRTLLDGRGLPELVYGPMPDSGKIAAIRELHSEGWGEWNSDRFASTSMDLSEHADAAALALENLRGLAQRVGVALPMTLNGMLAFENILKIAEDAPTDLLAFRTLAFEQPGFADIAIKAEDTHKSIQLLAAKVDEAFHVDALPESETMKQCIRTFRRGDGFFNFMKSDWRKAKRLFIAGAKEKRSLSAQSMEELMSSALKLRETTADYATNEKFRRAFGEAFDGVRTDFSRIRRLHAWYAKSRSALLADGDADVAVNLTSLPETQFALLVAQASRARTWMRTLTELPKLVAVLPTVNPSLQRSRKLDELVPTMYDYAQRAAANSALIRLIVRPTVSVAKAVNLLELRARLDQNASLLQGLLDAPRQLAEAAEGMFLLTSPSEYHQLTDSIAILTTRAEAVGHLGRVIAGSIGPDATPEDARAIVSALSAVVDAGRILSVKKIDGEYEQWSQLLQKYEAIARSAVDLSNYLEPFAKPSSTAWDAAVSVQAAFDCSALLSQVNLSAAYKEHFGNWLQGLHTNEGELQSCVSWGEQVLRTLNKCPSALGDALLSKDVHTLERTTRDLVTQAAESFHAYSAAMKRLESFGAIDWMEWGGTLTALDAKARLLEAREGADRLVPWSKYLAAKTEATEHGLNALISRMESEGLPPQQLLPAFEFVFYRSLSKGILSSKRALGRFSGAGHEQIRKEFAALDKELIALTGAQYAAAINKAKKPSIGISTGRAGELTEMSLLVKETKKQKRHIPIRQLLSRAGHSLQELKPCFMMGPLSVAQYLEQGLLEFDLVIMDEASQLRPEDALGAVARGRQLVVVGDPKQLPPTNFFDRLMDGDDENADEAPAVMEGVESILGICEHLYRPVRTLRWHYRSKHESLIAFSNSQFYRGNLVVFPSPYRRNRKLGVNYRYVTDGEYLDRRNVPEAQRVVDAVIDHMLTSPSESLGVVTLNQTQRELIEDLLDKKSRNVAGINEYLARHEDEGWKFFVKNLENVQGDERDVIFVSTTFGKPPNSHAVRQNFGPINRPDGWRRLNVLFTRARRRLDLFTSMLPSDVQTDGATSAGRRALHDYLEFARSGTLPASPTTSGVREADSDFELAVAEALMLRGYETEPQVGVAGYFLDLGVRSPNRRSEFLAGIECDGVTYHSSLSARDRDRIRQEVLESLGWRDRIIRVWSTDWFADPKGQTQRLVDFLQARIDSSELDPAAYSEEDLEVFEQAAGNSGFGVLAIDEVGQVTPVEPEVVVTPLADAFVEIGDRVTYLLVETPDERHTVQIVDSPSNLRLGLLNEHTPVARALLGLSAGEDANLEVSGQPTRTIRVVKIHREPAA
ncbi:MAG: hypothetical protein EON56_00500 [Alphaproteobacteria bacterium]|nr:MAG: hypothetical protein EON56_00500 [Alphaproteobacteria bacterium]